LRYDARNHEYTKERLVNAHLFCERMFQILYNTVQQHQGEKLKIRFGNAELKKSSSVTSLVLIDLLRPRLIVSSKVLQVVLAHLEWKEYTSESSVHKISPPIRRIWRLVNVLPIPAVGDTREQRTWASAVVSITMVGKNKRPAGKIKCDQI